MFSSEALLVIATNLHQLLDTTEELIFEGPLRIHFITFQFCLDFFQVTITTNESPFKLIICPL